MLSYLFTPFATGQSCQERFFLAHRRSVAMLCMQFKIKSNPIHPLISSLFFFCRMCRRVLHVVLWLIICTRLRLLAVELISKTEPFCHSQCFFGTIFTSMCLTMCDLGVLRTELVISCWLNLLFLFVSYYFLFFFLKWVGCVGLGSWDRECVLTLSQPCTGDSL